MVDQNPIGRSSRSNPVTYVKAWDDIRQLYSEQDIAKMRGYRPAYFSFNVDGGRCEVCQGEGEVHIEMQFMADINLVCEVVPRQTLQGRNPGSEIPRQGRCGPAGHDRG
jgi:excinuclease ABC subunit A